MKQKKYHFCAIRQIEIGSTQYFDGTMTTNIDPTTRDGYAAMKTEIGKLMEPPQETHGGITLLSLMPISDA
jgi:hypothetical protein